MRVKFEKYFSVLAPIATMLQSDDDVRKLGEKSFNLKGPNLESGDPCNWRLSVKLQNEL